MNPSTLTVSMPAVKEEITQEQQEVTKELDQRKTFRCQWATEKKQRVNTGPNAMVFAAIVGN